MKTRLILIILIVGTAHIAHSQCNQFYQYSQGQKFQYTSFDKKGKPSQEEYQEVTMFEKTPDGFNMAITSRIVDQKGKEVVSSTIDGACSNGVYEFDVRNFLNDEMMSAFNGMEITAEGQPLEIPNELSVGQTLPSGDCRISAGSEGTTFMTITMNVSNRSVTGRETITTGAGEFDCYVIEQDVEVKMIFNSQYHSKEYVTQKYGPVRIETFNKSGKLVSTRDLTKVE